MFCDVLRKHEHNFAENFCFISLHCQTVMWVDLLPNLYYSAALTVLSTL